MSLSRCSATLGARQRVQGVATLAISPCFLACQAIHPRQRTQPEERSDVAAVENSADAALLPIKVRAKRRSATSAAAHDQVATSVSRCQWCLQWSRHSNFWQAHLSVCRSYMTVQNTACAPMWTFVSRLATRRVSRVRAELHIARRRRISYITKSMPVPSVGRLAGGVRVRAASSSGRSPYGHVVRIACAR
jgi:hypothetical protein